MIEIYKDNTDDKIKILFATVKMIRLMPDEPIVWKFNVEYLDLLCEYMHIISHNRLLNEKFLDAAIDSTTNDPGCMGRFSFYPLIKV